MLVVELRFPAGRFHATPWGRHVNEGVPEWPPAPFRLCRALYDCWRRKRRAWPDERVRPLIEALASQPPRFQLPPARAAHTRSYVSTNERKRSAKTLIFDGFAVLDPEEPVLLGWPAVDLSPDQRSDLAELLALLDYLGRSESWVRARLLDGADPGWNCQPEGADDGASEVVPVACAVAPEHYAEAPYELPGRRRSDPPQAVGWLAALAWGTGDLFANRRPRHWPRLAAPPVLRRVPYRRPLHALDARLERAPATTGRGVEGVLYALEGKVLPPVTETVELAERVRRKAMGIHKRLAGDEGLVSPRFSGKDEQGRPLRGHPHSFFLPLDQDADGKLDHLLVVGRSALDTKEQAALDQLGSVWQRKGKPDLGFVPVLWGTARELRRPARVVESATPFVPPRHYREKRDGPFSDWLAQELRRELANHELPDVAEVEPLERYSSERRDYRWLEFTRSRKGVRPARGFGLRLRFTEPVRAPFALGRDCHFGLGLFVDREGSSL